jgi:LmbE family N-acetylglucosaminyl deacetylase
MRVAPTILFFHAHPDDESLFTAGTSALYHERAIRTVVVTCTDGRWGFDLAGRAGVTAGHDDEQTARVRADELRAAAALCGIDHVVQWEFFDSGMAGWPQARDPRAFVNQPIDELAHRLARFCDDNDVAAIVTYDERGFYGHPDHIHANRIALAAAGLSTTIRRVWYPVISTQRFENFVPRARARGVSLPAWITDGSSGTAEELIVCRPPTSAHASQKRAAIGAHRSQIDNADLLTMGDELFDELFADETYQLGWASSLDDHGHHEDLLGDLT